MRLLLTNPGRDNTINLRDRIQVNPYDPGLSTAPVFAVMSRLFADRFRVIPGPLIDVALKQ
jgi:hypothetical protein